MPTLVVLHGDQTGEELLLQALRVLAPEVIGLELELLHFDLSLESRRASRNRVVYEAAEALKTYGVGLKAATITPEGPGDVGSPNALLREAIGAQVILRTGRRIPGVRPVTGVMNPISVVRMAVEDAYGAREWREGGGLEEVAYRTSRITRRTCRVVAEFSFRHARRIRGKVFGGPKYTVSPVYEGMLKEELDAAASRHPDVPYEPQLIDAVYALLLQPSEEALVIPALNRDGDTLSDLVLQMFGSIAGAESLVLALDESFEPRVVLAEAPHGTAPRLYGKNIANPMAMILAAAAALGYLPDPRAGQASRAVYEATFETVQAGVRTPDLGGAATTTEFTEEVIRRVEQGRRAQG
ncbi:MAG: isocitrate/isopropylmalate family dehydrogenase [Armatimonadota bacterium]|nr:isocitrate/isopropylmalate family dehydrogenase [Armatimonadota bacterium]MDR7444781.1 isocitrate/isopropylmalate family dehydrogenase [Armatimonadota bacterium]MDR7569218.1 isocitrate/isopropylmalate family dehydrogenase [Armatimonadota bacterium]MDR7613336.1 isocitrate/isopropylmalate family dehydrogenase [Armatimonadota bacterium]